MKHSRLAIEIDPSDARNHVNHAWGLMQARDFAGGKRHFEMAERLNPHAADILIACALGEAFLGETEKARRFAGRAFDLNPLYPDYYLTNLAMIRFLGGEYEDAAEVGHQAHDTLPEIAAWVAASLARLGRKEEAMAEAERFLAIVSRCWRGQGSPSRDQAVQWFLSVNPVKEKATLARLRDGLSAAGLPVSGSRPS
jgi:Flp pilus assembly protein TadD